MEEEQKSHLKQQPTTIRIKQKRKRQDNLTMRFEKKKKNKNPTRKKNQSGMKLPETELNWIAKQRTSNPPRNFGSKRNYNYKKGEIK